MKTRTTICALALSALLGLSLPAAAHHGYPQYDMSVSVPIEGTVVSYHLANPHSEIVLKVPNKTGEDELWVVETTDPLRGMRSKGFTPGTFKAGDQVKMMVSPARNGDHTAVFKSVELPDGRILPPPHDS